VARGLSDILERYVFTMLCRLGLHCRTHIFLTTLLYNHQLRFSGISKPVDLAVRMPSSAMFSSRQRACLGSLVTSCLALRLQRFEEAEGAVI